MFTFSLGREQKLKTTESTLSNLHINEEEYNLKGINNYEMKFASGFFMNTWCGIMVAFLFLY